MVLSMILKHCELKLQLNYQKHTIELGAIRLFGRIGEKIKFEAKIFGELNLSKKQISGKNQNGKLTLGIRPELVSITSLKATSKDLMMGTIKDISYFGETTYYKISCSKSNEQLTVSSQNSFGQISYKVGEKVKFKIDTESVVGFFD